MDPPPRAHHHPSHAAAAAGSGGREDCWSEGATEALIDAWGDRYLELSRGNLRQRDWKDVANAVNEHQDSVGKAPKTDVQCKNRIDTLKKKYKIEKSKPGPSQWNFFSRLDSLIGPTITATTSTPAVKKRQTPAAGAPAAKPQRQASLTFTFKQRPPPNPSSIPNPNPSPSPAVYSGGSSSRSRVNSSPISSESSRGDSGGGRNNDEESDDDDEEDDRGNGLFRGIGSKRRWGSLMGGSGDNGGEGGVEGAFGELARAIVKFGEIYERVESSKQQQMLELERQRMEFAKQLEVQRMQTFMDAQLELEKMKRPKYASSAGKR